MTREELRDYVDEQRTLNNIPCHVYSALIDGIDTLEQDPCDDAVSRQAVLDAIMANCIWENEYNLTSSSIKKAVESLPSVNPQPKTNKWIPVSERLPEDSELVLFSTKTDRVFEGRYFADNTDRQWYAFRDECFAWNNIVTAWMPLPTPYEPQESEGGGEM